MTWNKTIAVSEDEKLRRAVEAQRDLYPAEYAIPIHPAQDGQTSEIVASHSLIPEALYHAFATFGALMSPALPSTRRQHEIRLGRVLDHNCGNSENGFPDAPSRNAKGFLPSHARAIFPPNVRFS